MKIAFYNAEYGDNEDKIVAMATNSKYSHVELIMSDGHWYSSSRADGGVRKKKIEHIPEHWDIFDISESFDEKYALEVFEKNMGKKYNLIGALLSSIKIKVSFKGKRYCSELIANSLGLKKTTLTPERLFRTLKLSTKPRLIPQQVFSQE